MTIDAGVTAAVAAGADPQLSRAGDGGDLAVGDAGSRPITSDPRSAARSGPVGPSLTGPALTGPVFAVLVARDGSGFLPRALAALAAQTRVPDVLVGVDVGSRDGSRALLDEALPVVITLPRSASFGDAVDAALIAEHAGDLGGLHHPRGERGEHVERPEAEGWIWLLHDDCAPAPDALERLLAAVETAPSVAVAGCKQIDWDDDQRILDVGLTTTRSGARVSMVDRDEVDQGQHDERSDVLAVGTAGMLIRRDLWRRLGGPDPTLAHARDDLDLGRRAHLAGHRVVVVPGAVVAHAAAWATGRRPGAGSWWRAERRDALHLRLATSAWPLVPLVALWSAVAMWPRAVLQLMLRRPGRALDELLAPVAVWLRPDRWVRSRWRARRTRRVPHRTVRPLYAGSLQLLGRRRDEAAAWIVPARPADSADPPFDLGPEPAAVALRDAREAADVPLVDPLLLVPVEAGPVADEAEALRPARVSARGRRIRFALSGVIPVLLVTATAALAALHRLIGSSGAAVGPDLLPTPPSAAALWRAATTSWRPTGLGGPALGDPLAAALAALSLPFGGVPGRVVDVLLLGGLPLAALTAWWAAGALTRSRLVRAWAALFWAACPPLLAATAAGRVGAVLAHVMLPLAAWLLIRAAGLTGRPVPIGRPLPTGRPGPDEAPAARQHRLAAGCAAGLALTLVLAGAPSLAGSAALAVLGLTTVAMVRAARTPDVAPALGVRAAVPGLLTGMLPALVVPAALLLPWWLTVAGAPRLLLAEAGVPGSLPGTAPAWWHLLFLPGAPTAGPAWSPGSGTPAGAFVELAHLVPAMSGVPAAIVALVVGAVLAVPVLVLGALAPLRRAALPVAAIALPVALAGLATALVAGRVAVGAGGPGLDAGPRLVGPPGPGLSLFALGVLIAAVALAARGRHALRPVVRAARFGSVRRLSRGVAVAVVAAVALLGPLAVLAGWAWQGIAPRDHVAAASAPAVRRAPDVVLPAIAADEAEGEAAARTLVLRVSRSEVRWSLARAAGPRLGDDSAALAVHRLTGADQADTPGETQLVAPALAALLGDGGDDARDRLAELGVGSVLVVAPVPAEVSLALDASPGLTRVTTIRGAVLWRVELAARPGAPTRAARARLVDARGVTVQTLPSAGERVDVQVAAGASPRYVVLTERADVGWRATLDGRPLKSLVTSGWAQCFELPATGGRLRIDHAGGPAERVTGVQAAVLALALAGLLPLPRLRRRVAVPAPPDPSRPVPRAAIAGPAPDELPPMPRVFDVDHPEHGEVAPLFSDDPVPMLLDPTDTPHPPGDQADRGDQAIAGDQAPVDEPAETAEPTEAAETAEPVEPAEPDEPTRADPGEPADLGESAAQDEPDASAGSPKAGV